MIFSIVNFSLLGLYYLDDNKWLININEFYNEIRVKELDLILNQFSHRLFMSYRKLTLILKISTEFLICVIWLIKIYHIYEYPVSFVLSYSYVTFVTFFSVSQ